MRLPSVAGMEFIPEKVPPARVHRQQPQLLPFEQNLDTLFSDMEGSRFSNQEKVELVHAGLHGLTYADSLAIRYGTEEFPDTTATRGGWSDLVFHVNLWRARNKLPAVTPAGRKRLVDGAKLWSTHFLRYGNIFSEPPHKPGWKLEANRAPLTRMREIMLDCYIVDNQRFFYSSTEDAAAHNEEFSQLFADMNVTHETLWKNLTTMFPGLHISDQEVKRVRDADESRVLSCHRPPAHAWKSWTLPHSAAVHIL